MSLRHLGADAAAFVDGTLSLPARERVIDHLARCESCRRTVAEQRRVKNLLGSLPTPPAPADLQARLLGLCRGAAAEPAASGQAAAATGPTSTGPDVTLPAPRTAGDRPGMPLPSTPPTVPAGTVLGPVAPAAPAGVPAGWTGGAVVPFPVGGRPAVTSPPTGTAPGVARRGRRRAAAVAASAGTVAIVVAAATVGATATQAVAESPITPPVQRFAVEHAAVTGALPLTTPGLRLVRASLVGGVAPGLASAPAASTWSSTDPFAPVAGTGASAR